MNINDYILKEIEAFDLNDSVNKAQTLFKNYPITHFPVIKNEKLLGSFAEEDIHSLEDNTGVLENHSYLLQRFYADEKATVLELLRIFAMHNTTIIPVLNSNKNYIGYYDLSDVLDLFSSSPFMTNDSETLVLEKLELEYSMGEVSQIVEANGGKLLGMYISERSTDFVQITLRVVSKKINEVIQTFRRYDYKIISSHENDMYLEDLKNRSEYLQKYLEM